MRKVLEQLKALGDTLLTGVDNGIGLNIRNVEGIGRGIFPNKRYKKDEFICIYAGDTIGMKEAKLREKYGQDETICSSSSTKIKIFA